MLAVLPLVQCSSGRKNSPVDQPLAELTTNAEGLGQLIYLEVTDGPESNYPLMAVWLEDMDGKYIQTLFVAQSIATGVFRHGQEVQGKWEPGERRRPAALPRWGHQRGIKASDGLFLPEPSQPVPDAYTGATPVAGFRLKARTDKLLERPVRIFLEINQSWDWNAHWSNTRFPDDREYKTSSQPAVVYSGILDPSKPGMQVNLEVVGRSHHSGADGGLYKDTETLTTALKIIGRASAFIGQ